jgi:hypothetical protein
VGTKCVEIEDGLAPIPTDGLAPAPDDGTILTFPEDGLAGIPTTVPSAAPTAAAEGGLMGWLLGSPTSSPTDVRIATDGLAPVPEDGLADIPTTVPSAAPTVAPTAAPTAAAEGGLMDWLLGSPTSSSTDVHIQENGTTAPTHPCDKGAHYCWVNPASGQENGTCVKAGKAYTCTCPKGYQETHKHYNHRVSKLVMSARHLCKAAALTPLTEDGLAHSPTTAPSTAPTSTLQKNEVNDDGRNSLLGWLLDSPTPSPTDVRIATDGLAPVPEDGLAGIPTTVPSAAPTAGLRKEGVKEMGSNGRDGLVHKPTAVPSAAPTAVAEEGGLMDWLLGSPTSIPTHVRMPEGSLASLPETARGETTHALTALPSAAPTVALRKGEMEKVEDETEGGLSNWLFPPTSSPTHFHSRMHDSQSNSIPGAGPSMVQSVVAITDGSSALGTISTTTVTNRDGMVILTVQQDSTSFTTSTTLYNAVPEVDGSSRTITSRGIIIVRTNQSLGVFHSSEVVDTEAAGVVIITTNYADGSCYHSVVQDDGSLPSTSKVHHDGRLHTTLIDGTEFIVGGKANCTARAVENAAQMSKDNASTSFAGGVLRSPLLMLLLFITLLMSASGIALLIDRRLKHEQMESLKVEDPEDEEEVSLGDELAKRFGGILTTARAKDPASDYSAVGIVPSSGSRRRKSRIQSLDCHV